MQIDRFADLTDNVKYRPPLIELEAQYCIRYMP